MLQAKFFDAKAATQPDQEPRNVEHDQLRPLVDHAIACARNWNYTGAKEAIEQAKRHLNA